MNHRVTLLLSLSAVVIGCGGSGEPGATGDTAGSTSADSASVMLTQVEVAADGTTKETVTYVTRAVWDTYVAEKEAAAIPGAAHAIRTQSVVEHTCAATDMWLYRTANQSGTPAACVYGAGVVGNIGGVNSYWAGSEWGTFTWGPNETCDAKHVDFTAYQKGSAVAPLNLSLDLTCRPS